MPPESEYGLQDLSDLAGVTPRTIRYYIAQGLLPSPGRAGPGATYTDGHLNRLRLIKRLQREHLPLAEIRSRLAALDDATVAALVEAPASEPPADSAIDYIRSVLEGDRSPDAALWNRHAGHDLTRQPDQPAGEPGPGQRGRPEGTRVPAGRAQRGLHRDPCPHPRSRTDPSGTASSSPRTSSFTSADPSAAASTSGSSA